MSITSFYYYRYFQLIYLITCKSQLAADLLSTLSRCPPTSTHLYVSFLLVKASCLDNSSSLYFPSAACFSLLFSFLYEANTTWTMLKFTENYNVILVISNRILVKEVISSFEHFSVYAQEALLDLTTSNHTANNIITIHKQIYKAFIAACI